MPRHPRQRRGDPVIRRILDAVLTQLGRVGFAGLSVPEVAVKARVNKTSVYRRWPTKQALVRAALEHSMEHVRDLPDTGALETDLVALAGRVAEFLTSPRGMGVLRTVFADGHDSKVKAIASSMLRSSGNDLPRVVIERAQARGELAPDADVEALFFTIAGALLHRVFIERSEADEPYRKRLVALVTYGVRPRR